MTNDVKIRVTADQKGAKLDEAAAESDKLRGKVEADARSMQRASENLNKARDREADAAGRVRVAELQLQEIRKKGDAAGSQRARAEEAYAKALRDSKAAGDDATSAAARLSEARAKAAAEAAAAAAAAAEPEKKESIKFDSSKSFLDKGQLLSEAKSVGIQAGAILGGALGAGISSVGAAGLFIGIAAAAQSENKEVKAAYSDMWEQVKAGAQSSGHVLSQSFIDTAQSLGRTFNELRPQLTEGMAAAKPVVADLTDGLERMARSAMPGVVAGAKAASQASNGLADMMDSAGKGVANFFTESAQGAAAGGDAFRTFGSIVERLGTFAGKILADLANNSGAVMGPLAGTVNAAAGAIENLAHTALPSLASGAGFALSGLTLLLNLANTLIGVLGPLVPAITTIGSSLKLVDMVSFGQVGASWDKFKTSVGEGEGIFGKIKTGAGALLGTLGPVGLAAGLVTAGLGFLSTEQAAAADAAAMHAKRVDMLTDALRRSNGVIDNGVRAAAAQALAQMNVNQAYDGLPVEKQKRMTDGARELNINQGLLNDAYLGQGDALGKLNHELDTIMSPYKDYNDMVAHANPEEQKRWLLAELMKDTINKQGSEFQVAAQAQANYAAATGQSAVNTNKLTAEFGTLGAAASTAQQKIDALMKIEAELAGRHQDVEQATKSWEAFIDTLNTKDAGFQGKEVGTKKWASALLDANGAINLTTDNGRKLFDIVQAGAKDFNTTAVAMHDSGSSADEVRAKLQTMRDAFIDSTSKMGFTKDQAIELANKYGLIPETVATLVSSNLAPEIQKAYTLGGAIRTLPDKTIEVTSNTQGAQDRIEKLIQMNDGRVITLHVNTTSGVVTNTTGGSFSRLKAAGGAVSHAAEGGARSGLVMVNEGGLMEGIRTPSGDLVDMEAGSSVVPHANMQAARGAGGGPIVVQLEWFSDGSSEGDAEIERLRKHIRVRGGNVQAVLGAA